MDKIVISQIKNDALRAAANQANTNVEDDYIDEKEISVFAVKALNVLQNGGCTEEEFNNIFGLTKSSNAGEKQATTKTNSGKSKTVEEKKLQLKEKQSEYAKLKAQLDELCNATNKGKKTYGRVGGVGGAVLGVVLGTKFAEIGVGAALLVGGAGVIVIGGLCAGVGMGIYAAIHAKERKEIKNIQAQMIQLNKEIEQLKNEICK